MRAAIRNLPDDELRRRFDPDAEALDLDPQDGRYEAREPRHVDANGTLRQRSFYGRTSAKAMAKRATAMRLADAGMTIDARKTTLGEYIDR